MKVVFKLPTIKEEAKSLFSFCYGKNSGGFDWSNIVYGAHPKLKTMLEGVEEKELFYDVCERYVDEYIEEKHEDIEASRRSSEKDWNEKGQTILEEIKRDFSTNDPKDIDKIVAKVSINPICPRYISKWTFNVSYLRDDARKIRICIHEIIHFYYFKKWEEIFPNYDKRKFEGPNSEWVLSEILAITIMNYNPVLQKITNNIKSNVYEEWQSIKINDKSLPDFFGEIYKKHLNDKISFGDFLIEAWNEYKKYKDIIEVVSKK